MAVILKAAVDNPWCREVLSTHTYTTSPSVEHPDGIILSNWFLRRIEDKDTHSLVECAKTGYVTQSGNCAASFAVDGNGETYLCVTVGASSVWRCIYDQTDLYSHFLPEIS
jgi:D-alanyl-D-alanine carboxypeptidase (penicillin-binding protein 5/6)